MPSEDNTHGIINNKYHNGMQVLSQITVNTNVTRMCKFLKIQKKKGNWQDINGYCAVYREYKCDLTP